MQVESNSLPKSRSKFLAKFLDSWVASSLAIALLGATVVGLQIPKLKQKLTGQSAESDRQWVVQEGAKLKAMKLIPARGFGFNNLISSWTFLSFLQYFGDDIARAKHRTGYSLSPDYFGIIINRDPRFINSYIYLSTSVTIFAAQPKQAVEFFGIGLKALVPEIQNQAYTVWRRKAVDQLLFLGDTPAARQSYLKTAEWAERAKFNAVDLAETKIIAQVSRQTADFLSRNPDSKAARINGWSYILGTAVDRKTAELAIAELNKLGIEVEAKENGQFGIVPRRQDPKPPQP
jgi:hypothetical protein